jgi:hypothetical protein
VSSPASSVLRRPGLPAGAGKTVSVKVRSRRRGAPPAGELVAPTSSATVASATPMSPNTPPRPDHQGTVFGGRSRNRPSEEATEEVAR